MDKQNKIKIAITAGISTIILLILVVVIAVSGKKSDDGQKLEENIAAYTNGGEGEGENSADASAVIKGKTEESAKEDASSNEASSENSDLNNTDSQNQAKTDVSGNSFYVTHSAVFQNIYSKVKFNTQNQLYEMYEYWCQGNTDAVRDLAHLERFEAMSYSLLGSSDFYYYGEKDSQGRPDGMGLAVYANSQYYYGSWSEGKRSGNGSWFTFYPYYCNYVVTEHLYSGEWADDLPDGQGQEHFDYDTQYMNYEDIYLQNAIGGFSQGKYNGEMYIITVDADGNTKEWNGVCDCGDWEEVPYASEDEKGKIPVLTGYENSEDHIYMTRSGAKANGFSGIIHGGYCR